MGGEPLLRPQFVHKVVYYAAKKGFWIYVPTNGRLLRPDVIDRLGDAGVATFNLAVDAVEEKPGLPKALSPMRKYFDYLVRNQYRYGYTVFFNMNICRNNMDDIKQLTEIAHDNGIATDYHINESPMIEQEHFEHYDENSTYITRRTGRQVDELVDWLIEKNRPGYKMVNSVQRLNDMNEFMRGKLEAWNCRAGQNNVIIRVDGTLAPCFPMYSATYDWGVIEKHKFEVPATERDEEDLPDALLFYPESQPRFLLQRFSCDQVGLEAGRARVSRRHRQLSLKSQPRSSENSNASFRSTNKPQPSQAIN